MNGAAIFHRESARHLAFGIGHLALGIWHPPNGGWPSGRDRIALPDATMQGKATARKHVPGAGVVPTDWPFASRTISCGKPVTSARVHAPCYTTPPSRGVQG